MKKASDYLNTELRIRFEEDDDSLEGFYYVAKKLDGTLEEVSPDLACEIENMHQLRQEVLFIESENLLKKHNTDTK